MSDGATGDFANHPKAPLAINRNARRHRQLDLAVAAVLYCRTLGDAAKLLGVHVRTLQNWINTPEFQEKHRARVDQVSDDMVAQTVKRLIELGTKATDAAEEILDDDDHDPNARASIVRFVIDKVAGLEDRKFWQETLARLEDVERRAAEGGLKP